MYKVLGKGKSSVLRECLMVEYWMKDDQKWSHNRIAFTYKQNFEEQKGRKIGRLFR